MAHCADKAPHEPHRWLMGNITWTHCSGDDVFTRFRHVLDTQGLDELLLALIDRVERLEESNKTVDKCQCGGTKDVHRSGCKCL